MATPENAKTLELRIGEQVPVGGQLVTVTRVKTHTQGRDGEPAQVVTIQVDEPRKLRTTTDATV